MDYKGRLPSNPGYLATLDPAHRNLLPHFLTLLRLTPTTFSKPYLLELERTEVFQ